MDFNSKTREHLLAARVHISRDQLAALRLTPLRSATVESFLSAAFSSLRFVLSSRIISSWPRLSAQAINVPYRAISYAVFYLKKKKDNINKGHSYEIIIHTDKQA